MENKIGAKLQWMLVDGSGKGVVHHDQRSMTMRCFGEPGDVDEVLSFVLCGKLDAFR
jgi:hypothetical protein